MHEYLFVFEAKSIREEKNKKNETVRHPIIIKAFRLFKIDTKKLFDLSIFRYDRNVSISNSEWNQCPTLKRASDYLSLAHCPWVVLK